MSKFSEIFKSGAGGFWKILQVLFSKNTWIVSTTALVLVLLLFSSITQSIEEKSLEPLIKGVGSLTLGVDQELKLAVYDIVDYEHDSSKIKDYWNIFINYIDLIGIIWLYFIIGKIFYHVWMFIFGDCEPWKPVLLSIATIAVFQSIYISFMIQQFYIPCQGIWALIVNSPNLLKPLTSRVPDTQYSFNETNLNLTNSTVS